MDICFTSPRLAIVDFRGEIFKMADCPRRLESKRRKDFLVISWQYLGLRMPQMQKMTERCIILRCMVEAHREEFPNGLNVANTNQYHRIVNTLRRVTRVGTFEVCVPRFPTHVTLRIFIMQDLASQLLFLANRNAGQAIPPLFWPVNCIKIGGHVALLSDPTVNCLYCANIANTYKRSIFKNFKFIEKQQVWYQKKGNSFKISYLLLYFQSAYAFPIYGGGLWAGSMN